MAFRKINFSMSFEWLEGSSRNWGENEFVMEVLDLWENFLQSLSSVQIVQNEKKLTLYVQIQWIGLCINENELPVEKRKYKRLDKIQCKNDITFYSIFMPF